MGIAVKDRDTVAGTDTRPGAPLIGIPANVGVVLGWFWLVVITIATLWFFFDDSAFWLLAGALASFIITLPVLVSRGPFEALSPWTLLMVGGYLAFGIRGLFMSLGLDGQRSLDELYFRGHPAGYFFRPAAIFLLGLLMLSLGYIAGRRRRITSSVHLGNRPYFNQSRLPLAVIASAAIGLIAFLLYARATGGLSLANFSAKRTTISGLDLASDYQSHGGLRVLATYSQAAFWLQLADFAHRKVPHGPRSLRFWWLALLFVNASLLPFYASTRSDVIYLLIGAIVIEFAFGQRGRRLRAMITVGILAVVIGSVMTSLRGDHSNDGVQTASVSTSSIVSGFVLSRTVADVATSSNIIRAVPGQIPYANGQTIATWLAAPIPRSIWPDKPIISVGPIIGTVIYGNRRAGVPPGVVAESYWNFGLAGVLLLPFLTGFLLRWTAERWLPYASRSPEAAVIIAVVAIRPGLGVISGSLGYVAFQVIQMLVLLAPLLLFVGTTKAPKAKVVGRRRPVRQIAGSEALPSS